MTLRISLSAYQDFQRCEQKFHYSYVLRLRPKLRDVAPERGVIIHKYMAAFYQGLKDGMDAGAAHKAGQAAVMEYEPNVKLAIATADFAGMEDVSREYRDLIPFVLSLADRYYNLHGQSDAERFEVLMVEKAISVELVTGIISTSVIDLVVRDRTNGIVWLVEHKSTGSIPDTSVRIRDFQTLLYANVINRLGEIHVDGVLWNYLRTKAPVEPELLKTGKGLSRNKSIDTNWETYERAIRKAGLDPDHYQDVHERLADAETVKFLPRFEAVMVASADLLLRDYVTTSVRVRQRTAEWQHGVSEPVRTLTRDCTWCQYYRVCEAAITGGDEEDVIKMRFNRRGAPEPKPMLEEA